MRPQLVRLTASATLIAGLSMASMPAFAQADEAFEKGVAAFEIGKYKEAIALWEPAAEEGNVDALVNLAQLYRLGLGVEQDDTKAFELYEKAAQEGSDDAQVNVAFQLLMGKGVGQDRERAAGWFAKAADQGNPLAQYNLGLMYEKGIGVARDHGFAIELYQVAASKGQRRAQTRLDALEEASQSQVAQAAKERADAAAREAAEIEEQARKRAEDKKLAAAAAAKAEADKKEAKRPLLSIKPAGAKADEDGKSASADTKKDDRPVVNVVRTPTRKPGTRVAGAAKGNEPTPIYLPPPAAPAASAAVVTYAPPPPAPASYNQQRSTDSATAGIRVPSDPTARVKLAETAYRGGDFATAAQVLSPLADAGMPIAQFWMGRLYNRGEGVDLNRAEAYSLWRSAAASGSVRAATALANLASRLSPEEIAVAEQRHVSSGRAR